MSFSLLMALGLGLTSAAAGQTGPRTDTTRVIPGANNVSYAWGTMVLRNGKRQQAYLPVSDAGFDLTLPYYEQAPDAAPKGRPKLIAATKVQTMRVQGRYFELLTPSKEELGQLAARRQAGAVELFVVRVSPMPLLTSFVSAAPVMGSPATDAATGPPQLRWYLRRPNGTPVLVTPANFATQAAAVLADDAELAANIAAGRKGYGFGQLEALVTQYNQRARR